MSRISFKPLVCWFVLFALLISLLSSCASEAAADTQEDPALQKYAPSQGCSIYIIREAEDIVWDLPNLFLVEFLTPGNYEREITDIHETIGPGLPYHYHDEYAHTEARILEVLKGDTSLKGSTITVIEPLLPTEDGTYTVQYLSREDLSCAILGLWYENDDSTGYSCMTPEWTVIPVSDDDTIAIWPYLEHADKYTTLASFREMVQEQLALQEKQEAEQAQNEPQTEELSEDRLAELQELLNDPENNGILGSEYEFFTEIDLDRALITTSLYAEVSTPEELAAFSAASGTEAETLLRIDASKLSDYLQEKFSSDWSVFSNFSWVYLENYDAWYHIPYEAPLLKITVTDGTVFDVQNTIHYTFTEDGVQRSGTLLYNDWGNLSYFESNQYN